MIGKSVRLGLMPPLSGLVAMYGSEISRAGQIACREVNENGGVLGCPLELVIEDDGSLPESAVAAANTLARKHRCVALVGNLLSNSRIAVAYRVAEPLKIPYLNFSFYEGSILSRYFFHFAALPNQQIDQMVPYMRNKYGPRMFFAGNNYEWPRGSIDAAKRALLSVNGEVVGEEYCPIGVFSDDIDTLLDNVALAAPDVFVPYFAGVDQVNLLTRFTERGLKKQMAVVMGHYDEMMASRLPPEVRDGFYSSNTYFMPVDTPENDYYLKRLSALPEVSGLWPQGNGILTNFGEGAYLCVKAFAEAANKAGSLEPEALVEALETVSLSSPQGQVSMDPETHHAQVNTYLTRCRADGNFTIIETFGSIAPIIPERYGHQRISHQATMEEDIRLQARMLEQMSEGVFLFNTKDKTLIYANTGGEKLFDCDTGELIGKHLSQFMAPSDQGPEEMARRIMDVLERRGHWQGEIRNRIKNGNPFWYLVTISTFTHPVHGEVWMAVFRDITTEKKMQQELEQHRNHLQQMVDERTAALDVIKQRLLDTQAAARMGQWELDLGANTLIWADEVSQIFEIDLTQFKPSYEAFLVAVHPEDRDAVNGAYQQSLKDQRPYNITHRLLMADGRIKYVTEHCRTDFDGAGNPLISIGSVQDVTELKKTENALHKAHDELEAKVEQRTQELQQSWEKLSQEIAERKEVEAKLRQAYKMEAIGTLAGGIAHDFNNILGIIIGNTELAMDDVPDWNPAHNNLEEIKIAGMRAKEIVKQLLSFSRKTNQIQKNISILPIIKESIKLIRSSIPSTIEIQLDVKDTEGIIEADPTEIHQILINMCTNASHAMDENGGILTISLSETQLDNISRYQFQDIEPGVYVQLAFTDTGIGIDNSILDKVFDPYYTTKEIGKGTGMGLAVVHGIVESYNGAISVYSEPGQGTTFKILFPLVDKKLIQEEKPLDIIPTGNEKILFIDDEKELLKIGADILERLGYSVVTETNPVQALDLIKTDPFLFDLIITDMTMPHLTGDQLTQKVLEVNPEMPIIMCTGFSYKIDRETALKIGISQYIEKPLKKIQLATAVREVLSKSKRFNDHSSDRSQF